jgi:hypothetical protein
MGEDLIPSLVAAGAGSGAMLLAMGRTRFRALLNRLLRRR